MSKLKKTKHPFPCFSIWQQFKRKLYRTFALFLVLFLSSVVLLRFVPVPFSAYMLQQKIGYLFEGNLSSTTHYQWVPLEQISQSMQLAVIASEDQRFATHYGFDWDAIQSALQHNQRGKRIRGGSTISQQTAKNLYLWHGQSWLRKAIEMPTTLVLETLWSKKRILEVYLNIAEFGPNIFGVEAASQHYFHKPAKQLSNAEAALLAAVLPNPIIFKVDKPSAYVKKRQQHIQRQMRLLGKKHLSQLD
ncbi:TPA: monofunctional biosynthetic peptidoglycan transglycosylase [Pasteurella multocida]|nr:monofunctional biosynthetic peptidoglycan transglycosylase [Pasteurella multocida]HDR1411010.1 monofunctional biosynthetic peptidoglycan transglycosylase [Pasteurella multocida]HDR1605525.1 monofunctional biosynthetic peptidoglycan transglycosylase [Pasteurella multocida]HEA3302725.1 monofunctional biosynthetic peptidoglycan transglycosylase [Pasteurella multocida]